MFLIARILIYIHDRASKQVCNHNWCGSLKILNSYPHILTMGGFAMTFPTNMKEDRAKRSGNADIGSDTTKINLRALCYRLFSNLCLSPSLPLILVVESDHK
jgi:hypothetical protein